MSQWLWDGPEDSDEEIEEMVVFKNEYEKQLGIKFSKNGIKSFVSKMMNEENMILQLNENFDFSS